MDNRATHKPPKIRAWLARRPHWHIRFPPTSASRINQVERWFAEVTRKRLQRGVHRPVAGSERDIIVFIDTHNEDPRPCKRIRSAGEIRAPGEAVLRAHRQNPCGEL